MTNALRTLYRGWVGLFFLAVLVQVGAAGYGAFNASEKAEDAEESGGGISHDAFEDGFDFHNGFGYVIFFGAVVLFLLALAARLGRRRVLWALAAPVLVAIQIVLAWGGEDEAIVGIFHPLVALVIFGFAGSLAYRAWRELPAARM